jgi:DNA-binding beta-propeller fold protein YncE
MRRFRWVRGILVLGLAGALAGVVPSGASVVAGRPRYRQTAFVSNTGGDSVSAIDMKTRTKNPADITAVPAPSGVAVTPDGKAAFVANSLSDTVSTIGVKSRTKNPSDIPSPA